MYIISWSPHVAVKYTNLPSSSVMTIDAVFIVLSTSLSVSNVTEYVRGSWRAVSSLREVIEKETFEAVLVRVRELSEIWIKSGEGREGGRGEGKSD